jgi:hypothetical protein
VGAVCSPELVDGSTAIYSVAQTFTIVASYENDFVAAYLMPILYPAGLTRKIQIIFAMMLIGINVAIYGFVAYKGSWKSTQKICEA